MELSRVLTRLCFLLFFVAVAAAVLFWSPNKLDQFEGLEQEETTRLFCKQYLLDIRQTLQNGDSAIVEEELVNLFLKSYFTVGQSSALEEWVKVEGVYVNLSEDEVNLCMERALLGQSYSNQVQYSLVTEYTGGGKGNILFEPKGGTVGKLNVPAAVGGNISPWTSHLIEMLSPDFKELKPFIGQVTVEENRIILTPPING